MEIQLTAPTQRIAEAIRAIRKQAGITQEQLAKLSGLTERTIRLVESGKGDPKESTIRAICNACEIPVVVLQCMASSDVERLKISEMLNLYYKNKRR